MAVFISRLLRLPTTTQNRFTDDNGTRYEPWINRVGLAGVMPGCGVRKFCPSSYVSRQATAITLFRALELPDSENDHFTDDDGSSAEAAINAVVDAGLMAGCSETVASARPGRSRAARWHASSIARSSHRDDRQRPFVRVTRPCTPSKVGCMRRASIAPAPDPPREPRRHGDDARDPADRGPGGGIAERHAHPAPERLPGHTPRSPTRATGPTDCSWSSAAGSSTP